MVILVLKSLQFGDLKNKSFCFSTSVQKKEHSAKEFSHIEKLQWYTFDHEAIKCVTYLQCSSFVYVAS